MSQRIFDSGFSNWTADRLPDLTGRRFVITGGNTGLGFGAAKILAARNADVVIACRNSVKARMAVSELGRLGKGTVECVHIDLANMASVRTAAAEIRKRYDGIDAVINNAGVMQTPHRQTADGFELQFATNHLGHFLLDGLLFDLVEKRAGRFVAVASIAHKRGSIHLNDLMLTHSYRPMRAYCQTKLANLMFALELDRRLKATGSPAAAIACHPGYVATNLQINGSRGLMRMMYRFTNRFFGQSVADGAAPLALAAAGAEAKSGGYYGPTGTADAWGPVTDSPVTEAALDAETAKRLWAECEKLVGFDWDDVLQQRQAA